jgi:hypothetical protein
MELKPVTQFGDSEFITIRFEFLQEIQGIGDRLNDVALLFPLGHGMLHLLTIRIKPHYKKNKPKKSIAFWHKFPPFFSQPKKRAIFPLIIFDIVIYILI